jgi:UDP-N-acetylglucosamine 2-epimerase (non-hydrolysing)
MIKIHLIAAARPNFMKIAPLYHALSAEPWCQASLVHTGQHYDANMSEAFFRDLKLPTPHFHLEVGSGTHAEQTGRVMMAYEKVALADRPDWIVVVGDVNSTAACALVGAKLWIPVVHLEAGLRSRDRRMPEEINRLVTDTLSDYLFVSEPSGVRNLRAEGVMDERIFFVGNVMIDTLLRFRARATKSGILDRLGVESKSYALATLHRPSNVDDPDRLRAMTRLLTQIAERLPVIFPIHPRTEQRMKEAELATPGLILTPPLGYLDFLCLMADANLVLTDSGGIQEETTILNVPCLTLRENTERPVTVELGTNRLVGTDPENALAAALDVLDRPAKTSQIPELWDGRAGCRIIEILESKICML